VKCFWIFGHDWSPWKDVRLKRITYDYFFGTYEGTKIFSGQTRICEKCGKRQVREII